jgi:hypothetical protein
LEEEEAAAAVVVVVVVVSSCLLWFDFRNVVHMLQKLKLWVVILMGECGPG